VKGKAPGHRHSVSLLWAQFKGFIKHRDALPKKFIGIPRRYHGKKEKWGGGGVSIQEKKPKLEPKVGFVSTQEHDNNNFSKVD